MVRGDGVMTKTTIAMAKAGTEAAARWDKAEVWSWYGRQPWLTGANYVPATAGNQLEMWGPRGFDPERIDRELGLAATQFGMNTMRVFLIDLLWTADAAGFTRRIDQFLTIADRHGIRPLFVLFDSCWGAEPRLDGANDPEPGVHNSAWLQSPGEPMLRDRWNWHLLRNYVEGVVGAFARDRRVLGWDVWNEPCNPGNPHRLNPKAKAKAAAVAELLPRIFGWVRNQAPVQPVTSGLWQHDDWQPGAKLTAIERTQVELSDFLSFHDYGDAEQFRRRAESLLAYGRPVVCTEWLARPTGSTVDAILPVGHALGIGMMNWGLVAGRSQTVFPWDSWVAPYPQAPDRWFHDLLHADGLPFDPREAALFRRYREARLAA